ncbi:hypothetical protein K388_03108 [Streptomyces sp. KhCrAH-43]|nr:hypothetical protein K388_03108 [Streptomyces sp. KhCrAH-43]
MGHVSSSGVGSGDVPAECAVLVFDMKEYSKIPEAGMASARAEADAIVLSALERSGVEDLGTLDRSVTERAGGAVMDRGDGAVLVLPARHTARLVDPLLSYLEEALRKRERSRQARTPGIRLRVGIHVGPLEPPYHDGDAVNYACRFVDSDATRGALTAATDHGLMLAAAVSATAFDRSVRAGRTSALEPHHFLSATALVRNKPGFQELCWLHVPGLVPSVIARYMMTDEGTVPVGGSDLAVRLRPSRSQDSPEMASVHQEGRADGGAHLTQVGRDYIAGPKPE